MPKIQIFGGGIAGLTAALLLEKQQQDYQLFERQSHWGGKLQTTLRDGFALDHGFQVIQSAYPALSVFHRQGYLDDSRAFGAGAWLLVNGKKTLLADPLREFPRGLAALGHPSIKLTDMWQVIQLRNAILNQTPQSLFSMEKTTTMDYLQQRGFSSAFIEAFFRPFFTGIFLEETLDTPSAMFRFVFWALAKGKACLLPGGIQTLPNRIVADLNPARLHLSAQQTAVDTNNTVSPHRNTQVHYFSVDTDLGLGKFIALNAEKHGEINLLAVPSAVQVGYAPKNKHLLCVSMKPGSSNSPKPAMDSKAVHHAVEQLLGVNIDAQWIDSIQVNEALPTDTPYVYQTEKLDLSQNETVDGVRFNAFGGLANPSLNAAILSGEQFVAAVNSRQTTPI